MRLCALLLAPGCPVCLGLGASRAPRGQGLLPGLLCFPPLPPPLTRLPALPCPALPAARLRSAEPAPWPPRSPTASGSSLGTGACCRTVARCCSSSRAASARGGSDDRQMRRAPPPRTLESPPCYLRWTPLQSLRQLPYITRLPAVRFFFYLLQFRARGRSVATRDCKMGIFAHSAQPRWQTAARRRLPVTGLSSTLEQPGCILGCTQFILQARRERRGSALFQARWVIVQAVGRTCRGGRAGGEGGGGALQGTIKSTNA
jgi:hypothetical protein